MSGGRPSAGSGRRVTTARSTTLALAVAFAATLVAVPTSVGAPAAKVVGTYRITVTGSVATEMIGNPGDARTFRGTSSWTHIYPRVRFEVYANGLVGTRPARPLPGTAVERWDHESNYCGDDAVALHESGTTRGRSILQFGGANQTFGIGPFTWTFNLASAQGRLGASNMNEGDIPICMQEHASVRLELGGHQSSVSYSAGYVNLGLTRNKVNNEPGFPLDRLLSGRGFSYSAHGTNRKSRITLDELRIQGFSHVTEGSVKIVFTPVR